MKSYFSKDLKCDLCDTSFNRVEFNNKLTEKGSNIRYKCKKCGAEYKLSNMFIWLAYIIAMNTITFAAPTLYSEKPLFLLLVCLTSLRLFFYLRKYLSVFRLIKK